MATRRRWFQYSLRGLLVVLTAVAIWLGFVVTRKQEEREAIKAIEAAGGDIQYDWQSMERDPYPDNPAPNGPVWLRRIAGDDYFQDVEKVSFLRSDSVTETDIMKLIPTLQRLRWLKQVDIPPNMSEHGKNELKAALPNCDLWFPTF